MEKSEKIIFLGGDLRMSAAAGYLAENGRDVTVFALEGTTEKAVKCAESLSRALKGADHVVLPLPVTRDGKTLMTPLSDEVIVLGDLPGKLSQAGVKSVSGGLIPNGFRSDCERMGLTLFDYGKSDAFAIANALPTAEGAVGIALRELPITLSGAKALVIGRGRIGRVLSRMLDRLHADVSVSARKESDLAAIRADSLHAMKSGELGKVFAAGYQPDVIFNTVPALLLDRQTLGELKKHTLVIDLASDPGGVDKTAAAELGHRVITALSLPGRTAPVTAGRILGELLLHAGEEAFLC